MVRSIDLREIRYILESPSLIQRDFVVTLKDTVRNDGVVRITGTLHGKLVVITSFYDLDTLNRFLDLVGLSL